MNNVIGILGEMNIALGAAVLAVMLLRRPLRRQFGAQAGYAVWLLVPIATLATQIPARMIVLAASSLHTMASTAPSSAWWGDPGMLLAVWLAGALLFFLYFARAQMRFHAAMRAGKAGPAVAGIFRPRIVTPSTFASQFQPEERDAVIAHERVHLSRQDTRINAAAALLSCLCWFNPLVHIGVRLMRVDQEMACDAAVLARNPRMRRVYAEALLKAQMISSPLPLGCYWPGGTEHPLMERMAMIKSNPPGVLRRAAGAGAVVMASALAGWSAWATQPPRIVFVPATAAFVPLAPPLTKIKVAGSRETIAEQKAANDLEKSPRQKARRHSATMKTAEAEAGPQATRPLQMPLSPEQIAAFERSRARWLEARATWEEARVTWEDAAARTLQARSAGGDTHPPGLIPFPLLSPPPAAPKPFPLPPPPPAH